MENNKETNNSNTKKKEYKTKQVIIPSLEFLDCVIANNETKYPLTVCIVNRGGGCSWSIKDKKELQGLYKCGDVARGNILRASNTRGETYIEISYNGKYCMQKDEFTNISHMQALSLNDIQDIYDSIYHREEYIAKLEEEKKRLKELKALELEEIGEVDEALIMKQS